MEKKILKIFLVFQITAFELGVANSHNLQQVTCHRQSIYFFIIYLFALYLKLTFPSLQLKP